MTGRFVLGDKEFTGLDSARLVRVGVRDTVAYLRNPVAVVPPAHNSVSFFRIRINAARRFIIEIIEKVGALGERLRGIISQPDERIIPIFRRTGKTGGDGNGRFVIGVNNERRNHNGDNRIRHHSRPDRFFERRNRGCNLRNGGGCLFTADGSFDTPLA